MKWISLAALMIVALSVTACKENEADDLAKAQQCLDKVPQNSPEVLRPAWHTCRSTLRNKRTS